MRAVARYRIEHDVTDEIADLGPDPEDQRARSAWQQAIVRQVQRRLGRGIVRERDLGIDR